LKWGGEIGDRRAEGRGVEGVGFGGLEPGGDQEVEIAEFESEEADVGGAEVGRGIEVEAGTEDLFFEDEAAGGRGREF
jgi:hypothetical protein